MKFLAVIAVTLSLLGLINAQASASASASASVSGEVSLNGLSYQANGNITAESTYSFRQVTFLDFFNSNLYVSESVQASGGSASADGLIGITSFPLSILSLTAPFPPTTWLAYFESDVSGMYSDSSATIDVSGSASFAAHLFYSISEVDSNQNTLSLNLLMSRTWTANSVQTSGYLSYVTYTSNDNNWWVNITIAVSAITGRLSVGGSIITPRSIETFVEIGGYPYQSNGNSLVLTMFTAAITSQKGTVIDETITAGSGLAEAYFHFDGSCVADGSKSKASVSGLTNTNIGASDFQNPSLVASINAALSGSLTADYRNISISFPAGANVITYDPTYGFAPPSEINIGSFLAPSFLLALISFLLFLVEF